MELAKAYDPTTVQDEIGAQWDAQKLWHAEPDARKNRYSIVIPPPNVTGALHLGHAINNTLQDILIRLHRMRGDNTVWLPGTDHAGIATQTVVDKRLQAEGKPALKEYKQIEAAGGNGREQFLEKVNEWKTEYEKRILGQLKAMGCSCDWDRVAFTMDEQRSKAVREAFFQLFKAGLIYRGKRLVNWDPVTQTALADDEVEMEEVDGHFYYLKYPVCDANGAELRGTGVPPVIDPQQLHDGRDGHATFVTVATTRPETMLGDTAVAINPKDPRAAALRGKFVKLPIVDRIIPIIEDEYVVLPSTKSAPSGERSEPSDSPEDPKAKFSSGFLKVTPAHDPNDYALGQKYNLAQINVMAPDASISLDHGWGALEPAQKDNTTLKPFLGLARELARESIVTWFKTHGLVEKVIPYRHSVGHSYRSHAAIEPYLSDQWYCKVTDPRLAGAANAALAPDQQSSESGTGVPPVATPALTHGRDGHATKNDGLRFFPERYAKTFESWNTNIRDWCISRQLWWGHRIPVWSRKCAAESADQEDERDQASKNQTLKWHLQGRINLVDYRYSIENGDGTCTGMSECYVCMNNDPSGEIARFFESKGFVQDPDVLDTWFSSALWPLSTLGWPDVGAALAADASTERTTNPQTAAKAAPTASSTLLSSSKLETRNSKPSPVDYWNPTSVLATGRDIITLWVSRMVMFNLFLRSDGGSN